MTTHAHHTAETAHAAAENIARATNGFLASISYDLDALAIVQGALLRRGGEAAWLRQVITEHLRDAYPDAFAAIAEHYEFDPMRERK